MGSVSIANVSKSYGSFEAIKNIVLQIEPGEFVVMVGPSGCGKSTLLRTIAGLETVNAGTISVGGEDVTHREPAERGVAMVFQNYALYPHMTVTGNMGFGLKMAKQAQAAINGAVSQAARILHIEDHLHKQPKALSGGQKQRVAIGRAITREPKVFLFDEPLSNLDAALRTKMRVELGRLHNQLGATMIYVTHDQTEAMTMADRIVIMNDGEVEQVGSPLDLYNRPVNRFVAGFLGSPKMNFIDALATDVDEKTVRVSLSDTFSFDVARNGTAPSPDDSITIGIRPEAFGEGDVGFELDVRIVENLGRETLVYGTPVGFASSESDAEQGDIVIHFPRQREVRTGERISVRFSANAIHIFDAGGITRHFANTCS
ncbi:MAG: sn-glycerol-3-phosphate ABC transporter ATP-binding protein UgpC [Alphaproteobacteria bacterium]|nr:sn-glycerol-3-phosphate ABC transporter ATP-binding protein UgpC [Alphaproteobacteria bacterium]